MQTKNSPPARKGQAQNLSASISEIKKLHSEIMEAARTSLTKAIRIGELLTPIKKAIGHGKWLPWLKKHLPFSESTACNYIRCYDRRDELKSASVADLTPGAAYKLLAGPPRPARSLPPPPLPSVTPAAESRETSVPAAKASPEASREAAQAPTRKGPPPPKPRQKDRTGLDIPIESKELWDKADEKAGDILRRVSEIKNDLKRALEEQDIIFVEAELQPKVAALELMHTRLKRAIPHAVCPDCNGKIPKDCQVCKGRGFVSKFYWDTHVPEEIKKATGRK
jgi:hypothetical protein